jgi:hypothetical protein
MHTIPPAYIAYNLVMLLDNGAVQVVNGPVKTSSNHHPVAPQPA